MRIDASDVAVRVILRPLLARFNRDYPQVHLDIVTDGRLGDIVSAGFDAGIRLAEAVPQDMIAVRLVDTVRFAAVASPDYLTSRGRPVVPQELYRHDTLAPTMRGDVRDVPQKDGSWNTIHGRFRRWSEAGVWEIVAVTLAEIMAGTGHYSIDSTTVRAHVSAAGGKRGLIDALLAAREAGPPVSLSAWLMPSGDRSPST